jgi:hypothetical protein
VVRIEEEQGGWWRRRPQTPGSSLSGAFSAGGWLVSAELEVKFNIDCPLVNATKTRAAARYYQFHVKGKPIKSS